MCFESLLRQTYQNFEIIVCDDNSSDNSLEILRSWAKKDKRIRVIHSETSLKASGARNRCLEEAKGEFVAIQDIDDYSVSGLNKELTCINIYNTIEGIIYTG